MHLNNHTKHTRFSMSFFVANVQALKNDSEKSSQPLKQSTKARGVSPVQSEIVTPGSIEVFQA